MKQHTITMHSSTNEGNTQPLTEHCTTYTAFKNMVMDENICFDNILNKRQFLRVHAHWLKRSKETDNSAQHDV